MFTVMFMCENQLNIKAFERAFKHPLISIIHSSPNYTNYVKTLQYLPDFIIMELPNQFHSQLNFIQMIKQHNKARDIPILCFGDTISEDRLKGLHNIGVEEYFEKLDDFSLLFKKIEPRIKDKKFKAPISLHEIKENIRLQLIKPTISPQQKIEIIVKHVAAIKAFPFTVMQILKMSIDEDCDAGSLAKMIELDPAISAKILKIGNSVRFARSGRQVSSIREAVVRLGFEETRRIAMSMAVMNLYDLDTSTLGFDRVSFWFHCLATAVISEEISKNLTVINRDEAFICGLLHDFGILIFDDSFPDIFAQILQATTDQGAHFIDKEKEILDITHEEVIKELFKKWNFPLSIIDGVTGHRKIMQKTESSEISQGELLALCAGMGSVVAKALSIGAGCDQFVYSIKEWMWHTVKLPDGLTQDTIKSIFNKLKLFEEFIKIDSGEQSAIKANDRSNEKLIIGTLDNSNCATQVYDIYLRQRGHLLKRIVHDNPIDSLNYQFDMLLIYPDDDFNKDLITPILKILPRQTDESYFKSKMPIIIINNNIDKCKNEMKPEHVMCLKDGFDLRQLDMIIYMLSKTDLKDSTIKKKESDQKSKFIANYKNVKQKRVDLLNQGVEIDDDEKIIKILTIIESNLHNPNIDLAQGVKMLDMADILLNQARLKFELKLNESKIKNLDVASTSHFTRIFDRKE